MHPLLIPIEVISYLSRPISLSVRLFANMLAGHTLLKVFTNVFCDVFGSRITDFQCMPVEDLVQWVAFWEMPCYHP